MPITAEVLRTKIAGMQRSIQELQATIAAYNGAIEFAEHLLQVLEEPGSAVVNADGNMTVTQFAELIGGPGASATVVANGQE